MNRSFRVAGVLTVAAGVAVACGRAPEPRSAPAPGVSVRPGETTASPPEATTEALPSAVPPAGSSGPRPTHSHPAPTKAAPKPKPGSTAEPPPRPPDRWVLSSADRRRIEERTHVSFAFIAADSLIRDFCPKHDACVKIAFRIDPGIGHEDEDCWIDHVVVPAPLHEGGTVTWVVNNPCDSGT